MRKSGPIVRASAEQIRDRLAREGSLTDWQRVTAMPQAEVERLAEEEDGPLPQGWDEAVDLSAAGAKQGIHIRLDTDVLQWFRTGGPGYQTRINAVLKAFVRARQRAGGL